MNTRAVRVVILVLDTLSRPICHNSKVLDNIPKGIQVVEWT